MSILVLRLIASACLSIPEDQWTDDIREVFADAVFYLWTGSD